MECPECGPSEDYSLLYNCNQCGKSYCQSHLNDHGHQSSGNTGQETFSGASAGSINMETMAKAIFGLSQRMASQSSYEPTDEDYERFLRENPRVLTTGRESLDLLIGIALIAWVFGFRPLLDGFYDWPYILVLTAIISPAFIIHELAHKYMAIHYGKYARFTILRRMAFLTFFVGLFGFPIAAPGATMILNRSTDEESGIFAAVGPLTNFFLSVISLLLFYITPDIGIVPGVGETLGWIFMLSVFINGIIGAFNMIPLGPIDGAKILNWNTGVWLLLTVINIPMILVSAPYVI